MALLLFSLFHGSFYMFLFLLFFFVEDVYSQKAGGLNFMPLRCKHCIGKLNKNITQYFIYFFFFKSTIRSLVAALLSNRCDQ